MKAVFLKRIRKATLLILMFSITALMLTSFFPIVKQKISNESPQYLYYSKDTLNENDNDLSNISNQLNIISLLLWLIIVFGIVIFLGMIIAISKKNKPYPLLFLILSIIIFILSIVIITQAYSIGDYISKTNNISLAYIFDPFSFFYIIIIFYFFTIFSSIYLVIGVTINIIKSHENKNSKEEISNFKDKKQNKVGFFKPKQKIIKDKSTDVKAKEKGNIVSEAEVWYISDEDIKESKSEDDINDSSNAKKEIEKVETPDNNLLKTETVELEEINDIEKKDTILNKDVSPFKERISDKKKTIEKQEPVSDIKDKTKIASNFEKALSTAIEKKQDNEKKNIKDKQQDKPQISSESEKKAIEKDKELLEDESTNKDLSPFNENEKEEMQIEKQFNVRCPICNNIFSVTKDDKKIKCPFCNAEGVIE